MSELHIMVGIPGSGKSTIAQYLLDAGKVDAWVYPDDIRAQMIFERGLAGDPYFNVTIEDDVWASADLMVKEILRTDDRVLVDATHLTKKSRRKWLLLARTFQATPIAHYVKVDFETCTKRNQQRTRVVPAEVMERFRQSAMGVSKGILESEGWEVITYE